MKTKIIYISGNEVFEMAQIRAAFEEVRTTLGLDNDTILFGVPVDSDNALANTESEQNIKADEPSIIPQVIGTETITETVIYEPEVIDENPEQFADINEEPVETVVEEPVAETEPVVDEISDTESEEVAIPILSILSTNDDNEPEQIAEPETIPEQATESEPESVENILPVSVSDVINSEIPHEEPKKKLELEDILDATTPLEEYIVNDTIDSEDISEQAFDEEPVVDTVINESESFADTDATLEQLANEFAQAQNNIPEPKKSTTTGKIGKLKNILPFKKAKRDDSGLMGDLFGWAGIAANDEDFSIPGFFTSAGGQK